MFHLLKCFPYVFSPRSGSNCTDLYLTPGLAVACVLACIFSQTQFLFSVVFSEQSLTALSLWLGIAALSFPIALLQETGLADFLAELVRHSRPTLTSASYSATKETDFFITNSSP